MLRVFSLFLSLTLFPAAYGAEIEGEYIPVSASVLEVCVPSEILTAVLLPGPVFGSFTGVVDFAPTDSLLGFVDEYVMASLQSHNLRSLLYALTNAAMPELNYSDVFALVEAATAEAH